MTISVDIIKNKTELSLKVNKAIVEYIKRNKGVGGEKATIKTKELLNVAYNCVGVSDEILATDEVKTQVTNCVKTCLTVLEEVGAIKPANQTPTNFVEYLEFKKSKNKVQQKPIHGKAVAYQIAPDFSKKVSALKTNEIIQAADVIGVELKKRTVSVLAVKDVKFDKIKFCNSMFDYSRLADYIGCYNADTENVDFVSTAQRRRVFFTTNKKHILPERREIIELYQLINLTSYKNLFLNDDMQESPVQTILSLRAEKDAKNLSTESLKIVSSYANRTM